MFSDDYELKEPIGRGSQAATFAATQRSTGLRVAVKVLHITEMEDWKSQQLFERETAALAALSHSAVPDYIDSFLEDDSDDPCLYLVMEFVDGESLQALIQRGVPWPIDEIERMIDELFDVLEYLHGHSPPVLHRDIKPANILRRLDGSYALVDFGAVQVRGSAGTGGSTVIGTSGYLPMEQLRGRAEPASDIYALGATVVHIATGHDPNDLETDRGRLQYHELSSLSPRLVRLVDAMVEPHVEDRLSSIADARELLADEGAMVLREPGSTALVPFPTDETTIARRTELTLERVARVREMAVPLSTRIIANKIAYAKVKGPAVWTDLDPQDAEIASELGFRPIARIGWGFRPLIRHESSNFIGPEGFVKLELAGSLSLNTFMDDGTAVYSTSAPFNVPFTDSIRLTGQLRKDYERHLAVVQTKIEGGAQPIYRPDAESMVEVWNLFYLRQSQAQNMALLVIYVFIVMSIPFGLLSMLL